MCPEASSEVRPVQDPKTNVLRTMSNIFLEHARFKEVYREVKSAIDEHEFDDEHMNMVLTGPSGVGKSTILRKLAKDFPVIPDGITFADKGISYTVDYHPAVIVEVPPQPTISSLVRHCIQRFTSDPGALRGDQKVLTDRLDRFLKVARSKTLVLDEAQRIVDRNGVVVTDALADWLKGCQLRTGIILILIGLGRLKYMFGNDGQVERRWGAPIRFEAYRWSDDKGIPLEEDQGDFIATLILLAELSPVPFAEDVDPRTEDPDRLDDIALRFLYASQGKIGIVKKIMKAVMTEYLREPGRWHAIDRELLRRAYDRAYGETRIGYVNHCNPFSSEWRQQLPPVEDDHTLLVSKKRTRKQARAAALEVLSKS